MANENHIRTLGDYSNYHEGNRNTIELPEGNNVVPLRSDTIRLVQNGWQEDPNQHLKDFLKLVDSLDLNGSISTWEDLTTRFLAQFFPPKRTAKLRNEILMFQQHQGESLFEAWTPGGKLRDRNAKESWALLEDLTLYDNESWIDPRDFVKLVKAISLTQDVLINKITSSCEICSGPHDTQYCMENPEQAFVEYASSCDNEVGDRQFTTNLGPRNSKDATNTWKDKPNFNWERTQSFTSPQKGSFSTHSSSYQAKLERTLSGFDSHQERRLSSLGAQLERQQDYMINEINILWKVFSEKFDDTSTSSTAGDFMSYEDEIGEEKNVKPNATEYNDHEMTAKAEEKVEEESEDEFEEEIKEEEEEEEEGVEYFDTFPSLDELRYHEWLLKTL
ncbi:MAK10-like protein [Tanacetum coccineum]